MVVEAQPVFGEVPAHDHDRLAQRREAVVGHRREVDKARERVADVATAFHQVVSRIEGRQQAQDLGPNLVV